MEKTQYRNTQTSLRFSTVWLQLTGNGIVETVRAIFTQRPPSVLPQQSLFVHIKWLLNIQRAIMRLLLFWWECTAQHSTAPSFWRVCGKILLRLLQKICAVKNKTKKKKSFNSSHSLCVQDLTSAKYDILKASWSFLKSVHYSICKQKIINVSGALYTLYSCCSLVSFRWLASADHDVLFSERRSHENSRGTWNAFPSL